MHDIGFNAMIHKLVIFLVGFFICIPLYGQVLGDLRGFDNSIVIQVYEIVNIVPISEEKQVFLADELTKLGLSKKSVEEKSQIHNKSGNSFDDKLAILKSLFSPIEFCDYLASTAFVGVKLSSEISQLRWIVKDRKNLNLSDLQIMKLLSAIDEVENLYFYQKKLRDSLENLTMSKNLSEDQAKRFFKGKLHLFAHNNTVDVLNVSNLSLLLEELDLKIEDLYNIIYNYELEKAINFEWLKLKEKNLDVNKEYAKLALDKPSELIQFESFQNSSYNPRISHVLFKRKELGLNTNQINSLSLSLREYYVLEYKQRYEKSTIDLVKFEWAAISKVLHGQQFQLYVVVRNHENAKSDSEKNITSLEKFNLLDQANRDAVANLVYAYNLKVRSAGTWTTIDPSQKRLYDQQIAVEQKPEILKKLDVAVQKEKESKMIKF